MEICIRVVRMYAPDQTQRIPALSPDHFIATRSPVQFNWFIKGRVVCELPAIHAP
jgi:hypothetical protein